MGKFRYAEYIIKDIPEHFKPDLFKCSMQYRGWLWQWFKSNEKCKRTKVIICFSKKEIAGWGVVFKFDDTRPIMLYVKKKYRRLGIGSRLFFKLQYRISKNRIEIYKDNINKHFFKRHKF